MSGFIGRPVITMPETVEDEIIISMNQIKAPTQERAKQVKAIVTETGKQRSQFLRVKDYIDYLVGVLHEKAERQYVWPMSVVIKLHDLKALQSTGFISEKEMMQYITK